MGNGDIERFQHARERFHALLDADDETKEQSLADLAREDAELAATLRRWLADARDPQDTVAAEPAAAGHAMPLRIDRYRVVRLLGRGGMGEVYLAERDASDFHQLVALKLIRDRGAAYASRFLRERSILARLSHPNIAYLVDGGFTEDGQPWFAMEYVEGEPLLEWCDDQRADLRQRVRLFLHLCSAVQFAHRNLIVHRDIKPANILIRGGTQPKLLDFGIAKLLAEADSAAQATQTLAMTPAYASPEQRSGEETTVLSDIYQLGLVLYELLSGVPAHSARPERGTAPVPMASAVNALDPHRQHTLAEQRGLPPRALPSALRGDLSRIVRKALANDCHERYASATALADDLRAWLEHRPVRAHRGTVLYRLGKFLRRNWAATLAVIALIAASILYLFDLRAYSRNVASERDRAESISVFMQSLFSASDPRARLNASTSVDEVLALGAQRLSEDPDLDPLTRARLLTTVARAYQGIGLYSRAGALYQQATLLLSGLPGQEARAERARALAGSAFNDLEISEEAHAAMHLEQALALLSDTPDPSAIEHPYALAAAAISLENMGRGAEADAYFDRLRALRPALQRGDPRLLAEGMLLHGSSLLHRNQLERAQDILGEAASVYLESFGQAHPDYGRALHQLANVQRRLGESALAETTFSHSISVMGLGLGERHRDVGVAQNDLGLLYLSKGRFEEAEPLLESALEIFRDSLGADNPYVSAPLINLGSVAYGLGRLDEAERRFDEARALILDEASFHQFLARAEQGLGRIACARGEHGQGQARLQQARVGLGEHPARIAEADWYDVECLLAAGDTAQARSLLERTRVDLQRQLGADAWETRLAERAWQQLQAAAPPP